MKRILILLGAVLLTGGLVSNSFAATSVTLSRHNLSTTSSFTPGPEADRNHVTDGTASVCVFCHTPHGSNTAVKAPLWNKGVTPSANYTTYTSPTIDTVSTGTLNKPDGVSLACLSCHDGSAAMDVMVNAPSVGQDAKFNTPGISQGWAWSFQQNPRGVRNLDVDLRNDHPISMPYAGAIVGGTKSRNALDPKFWDAQVIRDLNVAAINNDMGIFRAISNTTTNVTDGDIRLFFTGRTDNPSAYKVQCASCHNPHGTDNGGITGTGIDDGFQPGAYPTFLQRPNVESRLCVTCHIK